MVEVISWIVGLVLGTAIFLLIRSLIPAIQNSVAATVFVFILCYGVGITVCQVAWIIGIIGGIIAFIVYVFKNKKSLKINDNDINNLTENQTVNTSDSEEQSDEL